MWQFATRRGDAQRFVAHRTLPLRERLPVFGGLLFWLGLILASACTIVALSRPRALVSVVRTAGVDLVILQDGSASMHVDDVRGDRVVDDLVASIGRISTGCAAKLELGQRDAPENQAKVWSHQCAGGATHSAVTRRGTRTPILNACAVAVVMSGASS